MSTRSTNVQVPDAVIGKPIDRVDGKLKVTGGARYAAEFSAPNLAHAVIVQSTIANGRITNFETAAAERAPGVIKVITPDDLPKLPPPVSPMGAKSLGLLDKQVLYSGQHVAVVVAETLEQAEHAASIVGITYSSEPPTAVLNQVLDKATPPSDPRAHSSRGDYTAGMRDAAVRIEQTYRTPIEHHNPMEPHATVAVWEGDSLTVYDATQGVTNCAQNYARRLGIDKAKVRVINPFVGGGFGCKGLPWPHGPIAAIAAKIVGRPVKLMLSRRQMFSSNGYRPETFQTISLGATVDGKLTAIRHQMKGNTSILDNFLESTGGDSNMTYSCPNVTIEHKLARLNLGSPTFMRAPGEASGSFGIESAMDELAHELKLDPIEVRLRNYAERDETKNLPWSSKSLRECYAKGAATFGWDRRPSQPGTIRRNGKLVGLGMATATYPASYGGGSALARMSDDGRVLILCGSQDLGTGTYTILTQIAAEELGVSPAMVRVEIADTILPPAPNSGGSTSAASAGSAVQEAARALRQSLVDLGEYGDASVTIRNGRVSPDGGGSQERSYAELLKRAGKPYMEREVTLARTGANGHDTRAGYTCQGFGAQFCEVEVDPDLSMVRVTRWAGAFAVGKVLNLKTLTSQLRGGIIFGIGMGLLEESTPDAAHGRFVQSNLADYHLPIQMDVPERIDIVLIDEHDPHVNPIGVKGAGEIGITGAAAAIANAVYNATGKRVRELPITLDKLL